MAVEEFRLRALTHGVKTEEDLLQKFCRVQLVSVCIIPLILLLNKVIEVGEDRVILRLQAAKVGTPYGVMTPLPSSMRSRAVS